MVVVLLLLVLLIVAAVAGYTGRGVTDSRDREFSLTLHRQRPRNP